MLKALQVPKFDRPAPDSFVADIDSALSHQFLDIAESKTEADVQPNSMTYHLSWKTMSLKR